jgi:hypothetical protein
MKQRNCGLTIALLVLISSMGHSQQGEQRNSLVEGAWALQFQITNNFTLSSFQGAVISGKYHLTPNSAVRLGVSLNGEFSDGNNASTSVTADTIRLGNSRIESNNGQVIIVTGQYLFYPAPESDVNVFVGVGPFIQYNRNHLEREQKNVSSPFGFASVTVSSADAHTWGLGATGLLGVEWFAAKSLSLHAEYGVSLQYQWSTQASSTVETPTDPLYPVLRMAADYSRRTWVFNGTSVKFGLSVYF